MKLFIAVYRTLFFYFFIMISYRLMGKREIGQLGVIDLIVSILIAELVAISIENYKDSMMLTIVPILLLLFLEIAAGYLSLKFNKLRNIVDGKPSLIINRGIINYKEMIKQRYTLHDLMMELRNNNIKNLNDVEYAVLENNGKLNIFKYSFLGLDNSLPFPLILDGVIQKDTLNYLEKDESWLYGYLKDNSFYSQTLYSPKENG